MVRTGLCDKSGQMICNEENFCEYNYNPSWSYPWWGPETVQTYKCTTFPRKIMAKDIDSHLFGSSLGCLPNDFFCKLSDGQVVSWSADIIHPCPFKRIANNSLTSLQFNSELVVLIPSRKWALKPLKIEEYCLKHVVMTSEGLYLVSERDAKDFYSQTNIKEESVLRSEKDLTDILLADQDFQTAQLGKNIQLVFEKECISFITMLRLFQLNEDRFLITTDWLKTDLILYTRNGHIYQPKCVLVQRVYLSAKPSSNPSTKCNRDLPVTFIEPGQEFAVTKYLSSQGILRGSSPIVECPTITEYTNIAGNSIAIGRRGQTITVVQKKAVYRQDLRFFKTPVNLSLDHSTLLVNGVNTMVDFLKIRQSNEYSQRIGFSSQNFDSERNGLESEKDFSTWAKEQFSPVKVTLMIFVLAALICISIKVWRCLSSWNIIKLKYRRAAGCETA